MARLNEEGQWIILMGIMVSIGIFFLAFVINQSTLVGQTTAEGVLEFPKSEIQDARSEIFEWGSSINTMPDLAKPAEEQRALRDISTLARYRRNAEVWFDLQFESTDPYTHAFPVLIHYNNGVTIYNERCPIFYPGSGVCL
jgi:hypothetical protein